ncbi:helix-turn-helix domain-containing protein [Escherichia coli]|uniref:helix-turn-helix domain-containing protein n=1 Tax=Escherichia coli TaxID=562 RepID=UPI002AB9D487|nr:HTH domain-containing protein [Escherichia coli]MDZ3966609.1 helix-turn-helix domain-containing protein [Escherichia coli]
MASNYGENFTPLFKRFIKYTFKNPIAKTTTNKERFHLNLLEMTIYGEMASFNAAGCEIFISEQRLADDYDVSRPTVINSIKSLENAGLISIVKSKGKSNHYKLLITPDQLGKMCDEQGIKTSDSVGSSKEAPDNQQEAPKQATQQPEKPEAMQSPSQPKNERRERFRDAGKREIDEHGYPILTSDEMNARYKVIQAAFKDKKSIKLSELRDTFYGPEVMDKIKGTIPDKIWKEKDYWHLTEQALKVAKHVFKRGKAITLDYISHGYDAPRERLWNNCKVVNGELTITK